MALGGQVVDLVRADQLEGAHQAVLVDEVAVVEDQAVADVVDAPGVEGAAAADEAVDLVALLEQQLRQVAAVLAGDPGDECLARAHCTSARLNAKRRFYRRAERQTGARARVKATDGGESREKGSRPQSLRPRHGVEMPRPVARPDVPAASDVAPSKPRRSPAEGLDSPMRPVMRSLVGSDIKQGSCHRGRNRSRG